MYFHIEKHFASGHISEHAHFKMYTIEHDQVKVIDKKEK
jgi:hypothetical protein